MLFHKADALSTLSLERTEEGQCKMSSYIPTVLCEMISNSTSFDENINITENNIICYNDGIKIFSKTQGYVCKCVGTGFFGRNCEKKCPLKKPIDCVNYDTCLDIYDIACIF